MKLRITGPARRDLDDIWSYTQSNWGVAQADLYVDALATRFVWLTENRKLWTPRDDIRAGLFSYREGRHLIVFQETSEVLTVVRVLHERMDVRRHVK